MRCNEPLAGLLEVIPVDASNWSVTGTQFPVAAVYDVKKRKLYREMKYLSILQRTLGAVFVLSALLKMASFAAFVHETGTFMDAYFWTPSHGELTAIAVGVCAVELVLGVLTFVRRFALWACVGLLLLLTFFVWLTGQNLFFPTLMGSVESCGCFGELIHFSPVASLVKSVVLWVAALGVCAWSQADRRQRRKEDRRE